MTPTQETSDSTTRDLRIASLRWLEWFFLLLFVTLAVWQLFGLWALIPGVVALLLLVRSINTSRVANLLDRQR